MYFLSMYHNKEQNILGVFSMKKSNKRLTFSGMWVFFRIVG